MDLAAHFSELVALPSPLVPLDEAALVIAKCAQPELSIDEELSRIDALAADVPDASLSSLLATMFEEQGFHGNAEDYYDPRNSLLNQVMKRRTGIPITLALLTIEVGRRVGVDLRGVGMPGHFLLRHHSEEPVFIDPFDGGRTLQRAGCQALFHKLHGIGAPFHDAYLLPVDHQQFLLRILANLRNVFVRSDDTKSLIWVLELCSRFPGAGVGDFRDLAGVLSAHALFGRAADAYERAGELADATNGDARGDQDRHMAAVLRARLN